MWGRLHTMSQGQAWKDGHEKQENKRETHTGSPERGASGRDPAILSETTGKKKAA